MIIIDSSTLTNQNLSAALLCHTYTAKADRQIFVRLFSDQIAGNGNYVAYLTVQKLGVGSAYEGGARTTVAVPSGVTAQMFPTIALSVKESDVVKIYLVGLAGDTTTPDIATEIWDADPLTQFQGVAQAGAANTITLAAAGSPATDDLVKGAVIRTRGGTGAGQARVILGYVSSTKVITVGRNWTVNPNSTTVYEILGLSVPRVDDSLQAYSNLVAILGTALTETAGLLAAGFKKFFNVATPTGTVNSIPDAVAGAANGIAIVGSNMGNVTVSDKTGFSLSTAGILAIWHQLTSAIVTAGSIGKLLVDNINATIGSRLPTSSYVAPLNATQTENAVWDAVQASHVAVGSTGESLNDSASSSAPTVQDIDTQLSSTHGAGLWGGAAGTGFYTVEIPCEVSGVPSDGVAVRVTNDIIGNNIVAQATSDTSGTATVFLDAGTYYAWLQRGGDTFPNPTLITVP